MPPTTILRRIRAADGSPGVRTTLCGLPVSVFDAHVGPALPGEPGSDRPPPPRRRARADRRRRRVDRPRPHRRRSREAAGHRWRSRRPPGRECRRLLQPVVGALGRARAPGDQLPARTATSACCASTSTTGRCRPVSAGGSLAALRARHAAADTGCCVIRGGEVFSNGIHLNVIHAAASPAWRRGATSTPSTTCAGRSSRARASSSSRRSAATPAPAG